MKMATSRIQLRSKGVSLYCVGLLAAQLFVLIFMGLQLHSFFLVQNKIMANKVNLQVLKMLRHQMAERRSLVKMVCELSKTRKILLEEYAKYLNVPQNWTLIDKKMPYQKEFLVHRKTKLGWCKVNKAGSSSMSRALLKALGIPHRLSKVYYGHGKVMKMMPPLKEGESFQDLKTVIIVRHPFSRILSAFRDKFHQARKHPALFKLFNTKYGPNIVKRYRKEPILNTTYADMPTFREFCEYLIDTPARHYNEHWIPYYLSCAPCHIRYDSILKTETLEEDSKYLKNFTQMNFKLHQNHALPPISPEFMALQFVYPKKWKSSIGPNIHLLSDKDLSHDYIERSFYSTITREMLKKLYNIYRLDFKLFGYTIHPYDHYVE